jgi:hypothetical protein
MLRATILRDLPVNFLCWSRLDGGTQLMDRLPTVRFIIDHLGILRPRTPPAPARPWADLSKVPAKRPNNAVNEVSGTCTLSRALSLSRRLGPARPRIRCLGFRPLPMDTDPRSFKALRLRRHSFRAARYSQLSSKVRLRTEHSFIARH